MIGTYTQDTEEYQLLTQAIREWAENQILLVSKYTPQDYVLTWSMNKTTGEPYGPRGLAHSFGAAFTVNDAYNGLVPPSWAHGEYDFNDLWGNGDRYRAADQYYIGF